MFKYMLMKFTLADDGNSESFPGCVRKLPTKTKIRGFQTCCQPSPTTAGARRSYFGKSFLICEVRMDEGKKVSDNVNYGEDLSFILNSDCTSHLYNGEQYHSLCAKIYLIKLLNYELIKT